MKNFLAALLGLFVVTTSAWGQTTPLGSGLYKSAADFRAHRLTLGVDCQTETHKLRLNEFSGKSYVTVKHGGQDHRMTKASLFGFRDCEGHDYRFAAENRHYPILNAGEELLLYKMEQPPVGGKNATQTREQLFFSASAEAPLQPLTLLAVKKAFPDNHRFHDLLDAQILNGDLTAYDQMHQMTKINWLLRQSRVVAAAN